MIEKFKKELYRFKKIFDSVKSYYFSTGETFVCGHYKKNRVELNFDEAFAIAKIIYLRSKKDSTFPKINISGYKDIVEEIRFIEKCKDLVEETFDIKISVCSANFEEERIYKVIELIINLPITELYSTSYYPNNSFYKRFANDNAKERPDYKTNVSSSIGEGLGGAIQGVGVATSLPLPLRNYGINNHQYNKNWIKGWNFS